MVADVAAFAAARLGGVGGQLTEQPICAAYGGSAVDGSTVYLPRRDGTRAVSIDAGGAIRPRWTATVPANGPPVVGGGAVWVTDYHRGVLYALDPGSGATRGRSMSVNSRTSRPRPWPATTPTSAP